MKVNNNYLRSVNSSFGLNNVPKHVAIIMDGNGRWAQSRNLPRTWGHQKGAERVKDIIEVANDVGVKVLTLFAFSEENWKRPAREVAAIMLLLRSNLRKEIDYFGRKNIRFETMGDIGRLPASNQKILRYAYDRLKANTGMVFNLALSYSGRYDITQACKNIATLVEQEKLKPSEITPDLLSIHLQTANLGEPDLLIRTSGELRVSNFMLWQLAYTEMYFTPVYWPDFSQNHFIEAIKEFQNRQRRFGNIVSNQIESSSFRGKQEDEALCLSSES